MIDFIAFVINYISALYNKLDSVVVLSSGSVAVSIVDLLLSFIVLSMVVSIFWRGAKG